MATLTSRPAKGSPRMSSSGRWRRAARERHFSRIPLREDAVEASRSPTRLAPRGMVKLTQSRAGGPMKVLVRLRASSMGSRHDREVAGSQDSTTRFGFGFRKLTIFSKIHFGNEPKRTQGTQGIGGLDSGSRG